VEPAKENPSLESGSGAGSEKEQGKVAAPAAPVRKPGVPKEVPPFRWKLVGYSRGIPLTLLKCVEQSEAEAHLERYRAEAYYDDLAIHAIGARIPLPTNASLWPASKKAPKASVVRETTQTPPEPKAAGKPRPEAKATKGSRERPKPKPKAKPKPKPKPKPKTKAKAKAAARAKATGPTKASRSTARKKTTGKAAKKITKKAAKKSARKRKKIAKKKGAKQSR